MSEYTFKAMLWNNSKFEYVGHYSIMANSLQEARNKIYRSSVKGLLDLGVKYSELSKVQFSLTSVI
jgi:hypothetical protein